MLRLNVGGAGSAIGEGGHISGTGPLKEHMAGGQQDINLSSGGLLRTRQP